MRCNPDSLAYSLTQSLIHSLIQSLTDLVTDLVTHLINHSFNHPLTYPPTNSHNQVLTLHPYIPCTPLYVPCILYTPYIAMLPAALATSHTLLPQHPIHSYTPSTARSHTLLYQTGWLNEQIGHLLEDWGIRTSQVRIRILRIQNLVESNQ